MKVDVQATQAFVDTIVGIPKFSYPANQNGPRPNTEFATVKLLEEYQVGLPVHFIVNATTDYTDYRVEHMAKLRMRIGIKETDGIASAKIHNGWTREDIKALMFSSGYGFIGCEPISLEDAKLEKVWEPRQGFALELYVTRTYLYTIDNITSMEISGEFYPKGADDFLPLDIQINNT